jgi:ribosomal protein S19E (S16A)
LREGIDSARFAALSGRSLRRRQIDDLVSEGFIEETREGRIRVTSTGVPLLDSVVADLAA